MMKEPNNYAHDISSSMAEHLKCHLVPEMGATEIAVTLYAYQLMLDVIATIGWYEHTADWDPNLKITLHDDSVIETESGYYAIELGDKKDDLLDSDKDSTVAPDKSRFIYVEDHDEKEHAILTSTIKSIEFIS